MKSYILSLAIVAILFNVANAQSFHAGIKFGANVNKLSGQSFKDQFTYGYHAGIFTEIPISKKWTIQPEVVFSEVKNDTSSKFSQLYNLNATRVSNIKLSYLGIPLILNYNVTKMVSLQAGPQFGILLDNHKDLLQNGKAAFKQGDFSMIGGLQVKLSSLRVYARYAVGLNNLNDIDNQDKWKNQSIQLGIGLSIL
jgi:hypothetical protein